MPPCKSSSKSITYPQGPNIYPFKSFTLNHRVSDVVVNSSSFFSHIYTISTLAMLYLVLPKSMLGELGEKQFSYLEGFTPH